MYSEYTALSTPAIQSRMPHEHLERLLLKHNKKKYELSRLLGRSDSIATSIFNGSRQIKDFEIIKIADWLKEPLHVIAGQSEPSKDDGLDDDLLSACQESIEDAEKKMKTSLTRKDFFNATATLYNDVSKYKKYDASIKPNISLAMPIVEKLSKQPIRQEMHYKLSKEKLLKAIEENTIQPSKDHSSIK